MTLKIKSSSQYTKFLIACFLILSFMLASTQAWATFISPKRITIERNENTGQLIINNNSNKTISYQFEWEQRAQSPDGESILLQEGETSPGYRPVHDMIRFSPRMVLLKPGQHQKVRFLVSKPAGLPEGEYHSHFLIKAVPQGGGDFEGGEGFSGVLSVRTNASIPVFVRHGQTTLDVKLAKASLFKKEDRDYLRANVINNSTRSAYLKADLECYDHTGAMISTINVQTIRIYAEAKRKEQEILIPEAFPMDKCTGMKFKISGTDDFEYQRKLVDSIDVSRN